MCDWWVCAHVQVLVYISTFLTGQKFIQHKGLLGGWKYPQFQWVVSHGKIYENVCAIKRRESLCIVSLVIILQNIQHIIDEYIF